MGCQGILWLPSNFFAKEPTPLLGGGIGLIEKNIDDVNRHGSPPNNGVDSFAKPFDVYRHMNYGLNGIVGQYTSKL
jgi:hypothetical protein